jgi:lysozyme
VDPSDECIALVKESEGLVLTPYTDSGGVWTVGWGHELLLGESRDPITEDQAESLLDNDLGIACAAVQHLVTVPLTQGQLDALTDFVFNLGSGRFATSTMLAKLNAGDYAGAANQFGRWVYDNGVREPGLVTRRAKDRSLFEA